MTLGLPALLLGPTQGSQTFGVDPVSRDPGVDGGFLDHLSEALELEAEDVAVQGGLRDLRPIRDRIPTGLAWSGLPGTAGASSSNAPVGWGDGGLGAQSSTSPRPLSGQGPFAADRRGSGLADVGGRPGSIAGAPVGPLGTPPGAPPSLGTAPVGLGTAPVGFGTPPGAPPSLGTAPVGLGTAPVGLAASATAGGIPSAPLPPGIEALPPAVQATPVLPPEPDWSVWPRKAGRVPTEWPGATAPSAPPHGGQWTTAAPASPEDPHQLGMVPEPKPVASQPDLQTPVPEGLQRQGRRPQPQGTPGTLFEAADPLSPGTSSADAGGAPGTAGAPVSARGPSGAAPPPPAAPAPMPQGDPAMDGPIPGRFRVEVDGQLAVEVSTQRDGLKVVLDGTAEALSPLHGIDSELEGTLRDAGSSLSSFSERQRGTDPRGGGDPAAAAEADDGDGDPIVPAGAQGALINVVV